MARTRSAAAGMAALAGFRGLLRRVDESGAGFQAAAGPASVSVVISGREGRLRCTITLFDSLAAARADWLPLQSVAMVHPLQDWCWHDSWDRARTITSGDAYMIAVVHDATGKAKALYPLHVRSSRWGKTWVQPMAHNVSDYVSPLIAPDFASLAGFE
jgi:CelD/BcsL family acetyltransferase involved in cellulose biosynthesis